MLILSAADGSLWTPVVRPVSVPVVSRRTAMMISAPSSSSDLRPPPPATAAATSMPRHQMPSDGLESRRRATSAYSLPAAARTTGHAVNGPAFIEPRRPVSRSDRRLPSE